jgi:hypothetical protein
MPLRKPPRREPRVLALGRDQRHILWATVDAWEIRSAGRVVRRARSERPAITRLVRREKPTALVIQDAALREAVHAVARARRLPVIEPAPAAIPVDVAADLYPEFTLQCPSGDLARLAALALSSVLHADPPSRSYAPRRNRPARRAA